MPRFISDSRYTLTRAFTQFVYGNHAAPINQRRIIARRGSAESEMRAILEEASLRAVHARVVEKIAFQGGRAKA
jgi:hypothetical protein